MVNFTVCSTQSSVGNKGLVLGKGHCEEVGNLKFDCCLPTLSFRSSKRSGERRRADLFIVNWLIGVLVFYLISNILVPPLSTLIFTRTALSGKTSLISSGHSIKQ